MHTRTYVSNTKYVNTHANHQHDRIHARAHTHTHTHTHARANMEDRTIYRSESKSPVTIYLILKLSLAIWQSPLLLRPTCLRRRSFLGQLASITSRPVQHRGRPTNTLIPAPTLSSTIPEPPPSVPQSTRPGAAD